MEHGKCGIDFALNTGTNIPALGLGTWKIPKEKAKDTITKAIELGYRHFDCALEYGNQEGIGEALHDIIEKRHLSRKEFFITSKLWNTHHKRHSVYEDMESTLRQLKLHHVDLWLMHWPLAFHPKAVGRNGSDTESSKDQHGKVMLDDVSIAETWHAMEVMHKDGKANAIGVSNFTLPMMEQLLSTCEIPPAVLQIELHPYLQQTELIEFCQSKGILVTAYSPLGSNSCDVDVLEDPVLKQIAKDHNKTPSQVVLKWQVQRHIAVVPKAEDPKHMHQNSQIFDFELTDAEVRKIETLERNLRFISPKKIWGIPLFPDETGNVEIAQAVGEMFAQVEAR
jgi:diketogulonate reductase-like aldo/keto reductase